MSRKRGRDGSLTGGTGDVSPQFLSFSATQSAADTTTTTQQTLPIEKIYGNQNPTIIEVLKVFFTNGATTEVDNAFSCHLSTKSFGTTATNLAEPTVFAAYRRDIAITTSGQIAVVQPFCFDCTDTAGHGILVATDNLFAQVSSATTGVANTVWIKVLYRFKKVGLSEYIGIVQSQQ
jgi:hypothetical protein